MVQINSRDLKIISHNIHEIRAKIEVINEKDGAILEQLECGIVNCSLSISADSDIRRTANLECIPVKNKYLRLNKSSIIWMNRIIKIHIGIYDNRYRTWHYYPFGVFVFQNYGATYDPTTNTISLALVDLWSNFDASRNGEIGGAETIIFPAYEEDIDTGEVIKYNYIRDAVITTLLQLGKLKESQLEIDEIGEYKGMPDYNANYMEYREQSKVPVKDGTLMPTWNAIPFDQEFACGTTVAEILTTLRDLYPNYEMFFDENGNFICRMIPSCYHDDIILDHSFFDSIYISENTSIDLFSVRNVCEVWGESIETDFYTEDCTYSNNCYSCNIVGYEEKYYNGDIIGIKIPRNNIFGCALNINNFGSIPIIDENDENPIETDELEAEQIYAFKIKKKHINGKDEIKAYLLGQFQPHAVNVLTNGNISKENYTAQDGTVVKKYSKEYFQKIYNCKTIEFTTIPDSHFSIEELGLLLSVKVGGEYENITSDSLAASRASYENWKNSRLTDNISITTKLVPFADVNIKVSYRRKDTGEINQYIVKSVSHDLSGGITSWNLMRFYPLYKENDNVVTENLGTWQNASRLTWLEANKYTWESIKKIGGGNNG